MLISFSVKNFLSFGDCQTLNLEAGLVRKKSERLFRDKSGNRLVKFIALFGANASGKSNLVTAIDFSRETVIHGLPAESSKMYCRVRDDQKELATVFEYVVLLDARKFKYSFSCNLDERSLLQETFSEITKNDEQMIFSRNVVEETYWIKSFNDKQLNSKLDLYASDIKEEKEVLFLRILNQNKASLYSEHEDALLFKKLFKWFSESLSVNFPDTMISPYSYFLSTEKKESISEILRRYDTGIRDYSIVDNTKEMLQAKIPDDLYKRIVADLLKAKELKDRKTASIVLRGPGEFYILQLDNEDNLVSKTLQFSHVGSSSFFSIGEESDGTTRLMDLLTILLDKRDDAVYVIDEIDRCLHPQLTAKFVMDFLYLANKRNIQLIVTTHESSLLDFDILRKDEIWFVNKEKGTSCVYPMEQFAERFDKKIETSYKEGAYKAKPNFESVFPLLDSFLGK